MPTRLSCALFPPAPSWPPMWSSDRESERRTNGSRRWWPGVPHSLGVGRGASSAAGWLPENCAMDCSNTRRPALTRLVTAHSWLPQRVLGPPPGRPLFHTRWPGYLTNPTAIHGSRQRVRPRATLIVFQLDQFIQLVCNPVVGSLLTASCDRRRASDHRRDNSLSAGRSGGVLVSVVLSRECGLIGTVVQ